MCHSGVPIVGGVYVYVRRHSEQHVTNKMLVSVQVMMVAHTSFEPCARSTSTVRSVFVGSTLKVHSEWSVPYVHRCGKCYFIHWVALVTGFQVLVVGVEQKKVAQWQCHWSPGFSLDALCTICRAGPN